VARADQAAILEFERTRPGRGKTREAKQFKYCFEDSGRAVVESSRYESHIMRGEAPVCQPLAISSSVDRALRGFFVEVHGCGIVAPGKSRCRSRRESRAGLLDHIRPEVLEAVLNCLRFTRLPAGRCARNSTDRLPDRLRAHGADFLVFRSALT